MHGYRDRDDILRVPMRPRLIAAMLAYAFLGVLATVTLDNEKFPFRFVVWIILAALAVKTWIAERMRQ
jgi:hypothetical protein